MSGSEELTLQEQVLPAAGGVDKRFELGFRLHKWLSDRDVFKCLVSKGFRVMDHLKEAERTSILEEVFMNSDLDLLQDIIANGLTRTETNLVLLAIDWLPPGADDSLLRCLVDNGFPIQTTESRVKSNNTHLDDGDWFNLCSPLLGALEFRQIHIVEYLLRHGAETGRRELEAIGQYDGTDFYVLLNILLDIQVDLNAEGGALLRGALNPNFESDDLFTDPLIQRRRKIQILLEAGANPGTVSEDGSTCGHHLVKQLAKFSKIQEDNVKAILDLLLGHGLDINTVDNNEESMLHLFEWDNLGLLEVLLSRGADLHVSTDKGTAVTTTKICQLIDAGHFHNFPELLQLLLKYQADLTKKDADGKSILTAMLDVEWKYYIEKPLLQFLQAAEVGLLSGTEMENHLGDDDGSNAIPLMQGGCDYTCLLDRLAMVAAAHETFVTDGFDFRDFAACVDPSYDFNKELDDSVWYKDSMFTADKGNYHQFEGPRNTSLANAHPLKCYAVHSIRNQILKANGNRSIIPRARKLPLPQCMIEMVTLECYKMADVEAEYKRLYPDADG